VNTDMSGYGSGDSMWKTALKQRGRGRRGDVTRWTSNSSAPR